MTSVPRASTAVSRALRAVALRRSAVSLSTSAIDGIERFVELGLAIRHVALRDQPVRLLPQGVSARADACQSGLKFADPLLALLCGIGFAASLLLGRKQVAHARRVSGKALVLGGECRHAGVTDAVLPRQAIGRRYPPTTLPGICRKPPCLCAAS